MIPSKSLDKLSDSGEQAEEVHNAFSLSPPPKKRMITTPWTAVEEQRLKAMRDTGKSWGEISKVIYWRYYARNL